LGFVNQKNGCVVLDAHNIVRCDLVVGVDVGHGAVPNNAYILLTPLREEIQTGVYKTIEEMCPFLRECFEESINQKNKLFRRERCSNKKRWSRCKIYLKRKPSGSD